MSKPESETDPWAKVRTFDVSTYGDCRMERDYYGEIASEQKYQRGEYAWVDEVDAARAAEAAQHQQEIAALKKQVSGLSMECARRAEVIAAVEAERDQLYPTPEPETCAWKLASDDSGMWETACGRFWEFNEDGPKENRVHFCFFCGKPLRLVPSAEPK